ncbi:MAG: nitroreductase family protein [Dehalococcoidia bacterium]|jgi:nitroreductase|uniref:nitroreductase family protein n=1 Tax=Candidatus Amarobacter glycogenicus TaxID=3140699 RepID=UPI001E03D2E5|nr:nitroreductase family protein [Dehalococcoidia bacterium]MBK6562542.1 nitroreductase family protein [Dehalococcoidia bacterium]MBK7127584.1 nitroreductase family protein [Dehalococcoidia bacterium]MBK7723950.1 nitroreductase family protein [Dehalococcoidia bacterium]MBK8560732.1 nitroreductase family protein [Dehalococcoidia bacterium]
MTEIASLDSLTELMARQRAVREFTSDPIDDVLIEKILRAATRAPSAKNVQVLRFIVVTDPAAKKKLAELVDEAPAPGRTPWDEVPVIIFVCAENPFGMSATGSAAWGGSVYPGIQNLLLAAHAAGLGTVLTTSRGKLKEQELKDFLGVPEGTHIDAVIPMGWPAVKLGKNKRRPVSEVAYREKFGTAW